jgi:hypothetical protein
MISPEPQAANQRNAQRERYLGSQRLMQHKPGHAPRYLKHAANQLITAMQRLEKLTCPSHSRERRAPGGICQGKWFSVKKIYIS